MLVAHFDGQDYYVLRQPRVLEGFKRLLQRAHVSCRGCALGGWRAPEHPLHLPHPAWPCAMLRES